MMSQHSKTKATILSPSWRHFFLAYFFSVLAIPLAGIGLIALYFVRKKHKSLTYKVTDEQISSLDKKYQRNIDLVNIKEVTIQQNWLNQKLGTGSLMLHTSASAMKLVGMEKPEKLKEILEKAIHAQQELHHQQKEKKAREPDYDPGSMDKMEYLTGLWQQGLISDEDFENERKHFE